MAGRKRPDMKVYLNIQDRLGRTKQQWIEQASHHDDLIEAWNLHTFQQAFEAEHQQEFNALMAEVNRSRLAKFAKHLRDNTAPEIYPGQKTGSRYPTPAEYLKSIGNSWKPIIDEIERDSEIKIKSLTENDYYCYYKFQMIKGQEGRIPDVYYKQAIARMAAAGQINKNNRHHEYEWEIDYFKPGRALQKSRASDVRDFGKIVLGFEPSNNFLAEYEIFLSFFDGLVRMYKGIKKFQNMNLKFAYTNYHSHGAIENAELTIKNMLEYGNQKKEVVNPSEWLSGIVLYTFLVNDYFEFEVDRLEVTDENYHDNVYILSAKVIPWSYQFKGEVFVDNAKYETYNPHLEDIFEGIPGLVIAKKNKPPPDPDAKKKKRKRRNNNRELGFFPKILPEDAKKYQFNDNSTLDCPITAIVHAIGPKISEYLESTDSYSTLASIYIQSTLTNVASMTITRNNLIKFYEKLCQIYKFNMAITIYKFPCRESDESPELNKQDNYFRKYYFIGDNWDHPHIALKSYYKNIDPIIKQICKTTMSVVIIDGHIFNTNIRGSIGYLLGIANNYHNLEFKPSAYRFIHEQHLQMVEKQVDMYRKDPSLLLLCPITAGYNEDVAKTTDMQKPKYVENVSYAVYDYEFTKDENNFISGNQMFGLHQNRQTNIYDDRQGNINFGGLASAKVYSNICIPFNPNEKEVLRQDRYFSYDQIPHNNFFGMIDWLIDRTPKDIVQMTTVNKKTKAPKTYKTIPKHTWVIYAHNGGKCDNIISLDFIVKSNIKQRYRHLTIKNLEVSGCSMDMQWVISRNVGKYQQKIVFSFRDSLKITDCKVADFGKNYGIDEIKLPYYYDFYQKIFNEDAVPTLDISRYSLRLPATYNEFYRNNKPFSVNKIIKDCQTFETFSKKLQESAEFKTECMKLYQSKDTETKEEVEKKMLAITRCWFEREKVWQEHDQYFVDHPGTKYTDFRDAVCPYYKMFKTDITSAIHWGMHLYIPPEKVEWIYQNRQEILDGFLEIPRVPWYEKDMETDKVRYLKTFSTENIITLASHCMGDFGNIKSARMLRDLQNYRAKYLVNGNALSPKEYCEIYNYYDCYNVIQAMQAYQQSLMDIAQMPGLSEISKINTFQERSTSGTAWHCMALAGCLDNIYQLTGMLNQFVRMDIIGGWCKKNNRTTAEGKSKYESYKSKNYDQIMQFLGQEVTEDNLKIVRQLIAEDSMMLQDGCSLYPSAMSILGMPAGPPRYIYSEADVRDCIAQDKPFYVCCSFNMPLERDFPYLSEKINGKRVYRNGQFDKVVLGDEAFKYIARCEKAENIKFISARPGAPIGIAFDARSYTWSDVIKVFYKERSLIKKSHPAKGNTLKLIMNSTYGRSIMKNVEHDSRFIRKEDLADYKKNNSAKMVGHITDYHNFKQVQIHKDFMQRNGYPHIGAAILEKSKTIMSGLLWLLTNADHADPNIKFDTLEDLVNNRIAIGRQLSGDPKKPILDCVARQIDTDGAFVHIKYLPQISHILGKDMCQFHNDFEVGGYDGLLDIGMTAIASEFVMSKCYANEILCQKEGVYCKVYENAMKGVPSKGLVLPFQDWRDLNNGCIKRYRIHDSSKMNTKIVKGDGLKYVTEDMYREVKRPDYDNSRYFYAVGRYIISGHYEIGQPLLINWDKFNAYLEVNRRHTGEQPANMSKKFCDDAFLTLMETTTFCKTIDGQAVFASKEEKKAIIERSL